MKKVVTVLVVLIAIVGLTAVAGAVDTTPGSEGDPVVTKSYVDAQIAQLKSGGSASDTYKAVQLTAGQKLIGNEGTEVILRSGEATAIDNGANGVSDITGAKDLMTGQTVAQNHLLLIPRSDGRGILAATEVWIMVRGSYTIQ
ncbi:hypothetical protein [Sinanaerobacter chloroacetimidivorans]|uniref:Uncharacterized protein n=1 Tax=Sinanaerobacter chloroacetimidivorans TaxID=2818044 RepID=A0A8J7W165_9FIRM|nr:hypothetical protein [Sinanaerobacter chloroacetimidivorans]MBR0598919.1 hypothetical protein [Sinanaerobacter chloroacetimidivorans]